MNPKGKFDRGIKPPADSSDGGASEVSPHTLIEVLLHQLPSPPSSVRVVGKDPSGYGDALIRRGYRVSGEDHFGQGSRAALPGYEVVLLTDSLEGGIPLGPLLRRVRDFLKPGGLAAFGWQPRLQHNLSKRREQELTRNLIVGLYESGFSIQSKEKGLIIARKTSVFLHPYHQGGRIGNSGNVSAGVSDPKEYGTLVLEVQGQPFRRSQDRAGG